jgi:hypothetical protein
MGGDAWQQGSSGACCDRSSVGAVARTHGWLWRVHKVYGQISSVTSTIGQDMAAWWNALPKVGKAIGSIVGFLSGLVALFAALVALNVFSSPFASSTDRLTKAGQELSDAGSAKLNFTRSIQSGSDEETDTGQGNFDFRGESGRIDWASGLKTIIQRPYVYEVFPKSPDVWCRYDLTKLGPGLLFGALTGFQNDPAAAIRNLKEFGKSRKIADEEIFGVPTTHYAGEVNLPKLLARTRNPEVRLALGKISALNGGKLPVEVWLRKADDRVVRIASHFKINDTVKVNFTVDFSHFGVNASARQPAAGHTTQPGRRGCPDSP